MPDLRIRQLERQVALGDPQAMAQLLLERVRSGDLPADDLRLAAYLEDPCALSALGDAAPHRPGALEPWVRGLAAWRPEVSVRAALASAHAVLPVWEAWEPGELAPGAQIRLALEALEACARTPRDAEANTLQAEERRRASQVVEELGHLLATLDQEHRGVVSRSAWRALDSGWAAVTAMDAAYRHLQPTAPGPNKDAGWAARECAQALGEQTTVRTAIRAALVPWALGTEPLESRVKADDVFGDTTPYGRGGRRRTTAEDMQP